MFSYNFSALCNTNFFPQMNLEGRIIEQESWIDMSNVAHIDPETGKPTRIKYDVQDGKKVRVAKSGKLIAEPERRLDTKKKNTEENES